LKREFKKIPVIPEISDNPENQRFRLLSILISDFLCNFKHDLFIRFEQTGNFGGLEAFKQQFAFLFENAAFRFTEYRARCYAMMSCLRC